MPEALKEVPWKRNVLKVPDSVHSWLVANPATQVVVGCIKTATRAELVKGVYAHLGIGLAADKLFYPTSRVPMAEMGRYSRRNREGWEVKRADLPMITVTRSFDSPNWGDPSNGWHSVELERDVYQRDYFDPPEFAIRIDAVREAPDAVALRFVVDWPIYPTDDRFEENLLFALNLLQENVGSCGVMRADTTTADLLSSLEMSWEFFPPGTASEVERFFRRGTKILPAETEHLIKRGPIYFGDSIPSDTCAELAA